MIPGAQTLAPILLAEFNRPASRTDPTSVRLPRKPAGPATTLPPATPALFGADEVLAQRRTVRAFGPAGVPAGTVAAVLQAAKDIDDRHADGEQAAGNGLETLVFASRVHGVRPGLHAVGPEGLRHLGDPDLSEVLGQPSFATAPLTLLFLGSPAAAVHRYGSNGYLRLLRRAGSAGHAAWLAAISRGLDGAVHGNIRRSRALITVADLDVYGQQPLFSVAIGERHDS